MLSGGSIQTAIGTCQPCQIALVAHSDAIGCLHVDSLGRTRVASPLTDLDEVHVACFVTRQLLHAGEGLQE